MTEYFSLAYGMQQLSDSPAPAYVSDCLLTKATRAHAQSVAFEDGRRSLTFTQLLAQANVLAAGIQHTTGLARPRVAVLSHNSLEMAVAIMAIDAGGFWLIPLNPRSARAEIDQQVALVQPDMLIVEPGLAEGFAAAGIRVLLTHPKGIADTIASLMERFPGVTPFFACTDPGEPNAIKFTGDSSGRPKAVVQSVRTVITVAATVATAFELRSDEVYLLTAPMIHGAGAFMLPVLACGGRCVIIEQPRPAAVAQALEQFGATMTWMPPTLLYMLMDLPDIGQRNFGRLRHLIWSGAPASV